MSLNEMNTFIKSLRNHDKKFYKNYYKANLKENLKKNFGSFYNHYTKNERIKLYEHMKDSHGFPELTDLNKLTFMPMKKIYDYLHIHREDFLITNDIYNKTKYILRQKI